MVSYTETGLLVPVKTKQFTVDLYLSFQAFHSRVFPVSESRYKVFLHIQRYTLDERCNWGCFMSVRRTASGGRSDMRPSVFGTMNSRRQKATAPAHSTIATDGF